MSIFNKKPLSREDVLGVNDIKIVKVDMPEWLDGYVYVKGMNGLEREEFEKFYRDDTNEPLNIRAKLAAMTICDEDGTLLFSIEDAEELGKKSASSLVRIFDVSRGLNSLGDEESEKASEEMETDPLKGSASD